MSEKPGICTWKYCPVYNLGIIEYSQALKLQEQLVKARIADDIPDTILFLQHPPVLTMGVSGIEDNVIATRDVLADEGVTIAYTDRGGQITAHEPGQLVGYPIFDLKAGHRDLHQYIRNLEEIIIRTLRDYSILARRDSNYPGVWVENEKICAIGIRVSRWVTKHGFALNINNSLKCFSYIHPCGITDKGVTSLSRLLGHKLIINHVMLRIIEHCSQVFDMAVELESPEHLRGLLSRQVKVSI